MKLEVGMYARTNRGNIFKVENAVEIDVDGTWFKSKVRENSVIKDLPRFMYDEEDEIINKASHNIIDIIQSKDLIVDTKNNLYVVDRVDGDYVFTTSKNEYGLIITLVDYQIKSIVTKEAFESMEYRIGE